MQDLKGWAGLPLCAQLGCLQGGGERESPGEDTEREERQGRPRDQGRGCCGGCHHTVTATDQIFPYKALVSSLLPRHRPHGVCPHAVGEVTRS